MRRYTFRLLWHLRIDGPNIFTALRDRAGEREAVNRLQIMKRARDRVPGPGVRWVVPPIQPVEGTVIAEKERFDVSAKGTEETKTSCLLSLHLVLLQPLDRLNASIDNGRGGGHEEQTGQQRQGEDERLGIHCECRSVWVRGLEDGWVTWRSTICPGTPGYIGFSSRPEEAGIFRWSTSWASLLHPLSRKNRCSLILFQKLSVYLQGGPDARRRGSHAQLVPWDGVD